MTLRPGKCEMWVGQPNIHETDYYVFNMGMRLREAAEPTFTRAMATPTTATQPGGPATKTRGFNRSPAAGGAAGQQGQLTTNSLDGARRPAPLADREPRLSPTQPPPPSTSTPSRSPRAPTPGHAHRRGEAPPRPASPPSRPGKRAENPPSGADRRRRLHRPAAQQPRAHLGILS